MAVVVHLTLLYFFLQWRIVFGEGFSPAQVNHLHANCQLRIWKVNSFENRLSVLHLTLVPA